MNPMETLDRLNDTRFSRRTLLKGAGTTAVGLSVAGGLSLSSAGTVRAAAVAQESVTDIINIAITAEELAITLLTGALGQAEKGAYNKDIPTPVQDILKGALAAEVYHQKYLAKAGAKPLTETFTIPDPKLLTDYDTLFKTVVSLEAAFVAAYTAAAAEFGADGKPELVKVAYQIGTVEAEHRVLANYALGTRPANDVAFEKNSFDTVGDAAALKSLGFIGGSGQQVSYPGTGVADLSYVSHTQPAGPMVSCTAMPSGMPPGGGGGTASSQTSLGGLEQMLGLLGVFGVGAATVGVITRRLAAHREERAEINQQ